MKYLLSLLAVVFALSACAGPSAIDSDLWYDQWGIAHLTPEAEERIENQGIKKLEGYDLKEAKLHGEIALNKEAILQAKGGGCTLSFQYRSRTDQLLLIVGVKNGLLDTVSFQSKSELSQKAKQVNCILPTS